MNAKSLTAVCGAALLSTVLVQYDASGAGLINDANLLSNPSFNDLLLGWVVDDPTAVSWVPNFGVPDKSGNVVGAVAIGGIGNSDTGIHQCVPIAEGVTYQFTFSGLAYCQNGAIASAVFSNDMCTDEFGSARLTVSETDKWTRSTTTIQAPVGAQAVVISLTHAGALNCDEAAFFDEVFFGDQVFADGLE